MARVADEWQAPENREELEKRLEAIGESDQGALLLFALRAALRVFPLICGPNGFIFKSAPERHAIAVWRALWLASQIVLDKAIATVEAAHDATHAAFDASEGLTGEITGDAYPAAYAFIYVAEASHVYAKYTYGAVDPGYASEAAAYAAYAAVGALPASTINIGVEEWQSDLRVLEQPGKGLRHALYGVHVWRDKPPKEITARVGYLRKSFNNLGYEEIFEDYECLLAGDMEALEKQPWDKYEVLWEDVKRRFPTEEDEEAEDPKKPKPDDLESEIVTEPRDENNQTKLRHIARDAIHPEALATVDALDRQPLANDLADWLAHKDNQHHLCIGLFGDWGVGKSSFIRMVREALGAPLPADEPALDSTKKRAGMETEFLCAEFNAWSYEHCGNIQAGIAQEMVSALVRGMTWRDKLNLTVQFAWRTHKKRLLALASTLAVFLVGLVYAAFNGLTNWQLAPALGLVLVIAQQLKGFINQVLAHPMARELQTYLRLPDFGEHLGTIPVMRQQLSTLIELWSQRKGANQRILFVVDDLDRCSPEAVLKTFEAVRLVMDLKPVVVVIAIDQRVALASLALHYSKLSEARGVSPDEIARDYLGKIIHLPVTLDKQIGHINPFLDGLWQSDMDADNSPLDQQNKPAGLPLKVESQAVGLSDQTNPMLSDTADTIDVSASKQIESEDVKPTSEPNTPKPEVPKEPVPGLSDAQKACFRKLANDYALANPRQLKRLDNAYNLIRRNDPAEDQQDGGFPRLRILLWLEYLGGCPADIRQLGEQVLLSTEESEEGLDTSSKTDLPDHFTAYSESLKASLAELNSDKRSSLCRQVKAFVLPALDST